MKKILFSLAFLLSVSSFGADEKLIVVSSVAEKAIEPNMVSLNLEIWSKGGSAKQAQLLNTAEFQKVKKTA